MSPKAPSRSSSIASSPSRGASLPLPFRASWFALSLAISGCFGGSYAVTRVVDGREVVGPFVSEEAYALYLQGTLLEGEGHWEEAASAYTQALRYDPDSPDLWTRRAATLCALGREPFSSFDRAVRIDPRYEAAHAERARCHLSRGEDEAALLSARRAFEVEPKTAENVLLLADILEHAGQGDEAMALLDELTTRERALPEAHRARLALAIRRGDDIRKNASGRRLLEIAPDVAATLDEPSLAPLARIDDALRERDLERARELALKARVSSGALALRALALGRLAEARDQASLALSANPADSDARVALAMVAHLQNDEATLSEALSELPEEPSPLSEPARRALEELVRFRAR